MTRRRTPWLRQSSRPSSPLAGQLTTVFGFLALCFMSFALGKDMGLVMAKGVILGVITVVTFLPSLILMLDKNCQEKDKT